MRGKGQKTEAPEQHEGGDSVRPDSGGRRSARQAAEVGDEGGGERRGGKASAKKATGRNYTVVARNTQQSRDRAQIVCCAAAVGETEKTTWDVCV